MGKRHGFDIQAKQTDIPFLHKLINIQVSWRSLLPLHYLSSCSDFFFVHIEFFILEVVVRRMMVY
jgi:hypothetical protein